MNRIKILCLIIVLVIAFSSVTVFAESYTLPETIIYGDVNMDGNVTIADATAIQKNIAEIEYLTSVQRFLAAEEGTEISIKCATDIQKHIAKLRGKWNDYYGKPVPMPLENEFSKFVSLSGNYEDDCIIVTVKTEYREIYDLSDFPEYDFDSMSIIGESIDRESVVYILYLSSPSKINVLESIKALDYRANIDLLAVGPNYVYTMD